MKHELKIIMSFETEDFDQDADVPIRNQDIRVYVDEHPIGCIQEIKFLAHKDEFVPFIEFTFPDLVNLDCDAESSFAKEIEWHIERLKMAVNVRTKKDSIDDNASPILHLEEIGTDGFIDSIPMKRRHK